MNNKMKIIGKAQFGDIRILEKFGYFFFCGKDCAKILGYRDSESAMNRYCEQQGIVLFDVEYPIHSVGVDVSEAVSEKFVDEKNLYRLIRHSKLPYASAFQSWIFDEILPPLRRIDEATDKSKAKQAAGGITKNICLDEQPAAADRRLSDPRTPRADEQFYLPYLSNSEQLLTAEDIGKIFGVSKQKVGKVAKAYGIKTAQNGVWVWDKATYSDYRCKVFRYFPCALEEFKSVLGDKIF